MSSNAPTGNRQINRDGRGMANDSMPSGLRKFKSTVPANYKSPTPVRVPPAPASNKEKLSPG